MDRIAHDLLAAVLEWGEPLNSGTGPEEGTGQGLLRQRGSVHTRTGAGEVELVEVLPAKAARGHARDRELYPQELLARPRIPTPSGTRITVRRLAMADVTGSKSKASTRIVGVSM